MIYRQIFGNLLASIVAPLALLGRWWPNLYRAVFFEEYEYYDFEISSLGEFLRIAFGELYVGLTFLSLIAIFFPFQLIKNYYHKRNQRLSFLAKVFVLSTIAIVLVLITGTFYNIWLIPWYQNFMYIAYALGFGLCFTAMLYFVVDRYEEP